jgi:hypothetical protein
MTRRGSFADNTSNPWMALFLLRQRGKRADSHSLSKAEKECKYWLDRENFDVKEAFSYRMSGRDKREVKRIIFEYFEYIEGEWDRFQERKR